MLTRHSLGTYQGIELTRNSSVNTRPQSSQFAEPLWTDPGIKSEISVRELISTKKGREKERKVQAGNRQTFHIFFFRAIFVRLCIFTICG